MTKAQIQSAIIEEFGKLLGEDSKDIKTSYTLSRKLTKRTPLTIAVKARIFHSKKHTYLIVQVSSDNHTELFDCCLTDYTRKTPMRFINKM